jgi:hypothetical protein
MKEILKFNWSKSLEKLLGQYQASQSNGQARNYEESSKKKISSHCTEP